MSEFEKEQLEGEKLCPQKDGLLLLSQFLAGKKQFTDLQPFVLDLGGASQIRKQEATVYGYYLGKFFEKRQLYLNLSLESGSLSPDLDRVYAIPMREAEKGIKPYYWIDFLTKDNNLLASCRLQPDEDINKINFRAWHNIKEQIFVDFVRNENGIIFEHVNPFFVTAKTKIALGNYRFNGTGISLNLAENPALQDGDTLFIVPRQDERRIYQWIEILKVDIGAPPQDWKRIASYRILKEERDISSHSWYGPEKTLLVDYLDNKSDINFSDLRPFISSAQKTSKGFIIPIFASGNKHLTMYTSSPFLSEGSAVQIVPQQDANKLYQFFDAYTVGENPQLVTSYRLLNGELVGWRGFRKQKLIDYIADKVPFSLVEPIEFEIGKSDIISFAKEKGNKKYFSLSREWNLQEGDEVTLVPLEESSVGVYFHLMKDGVNLGKYLLNNSDKKFRLVELFIKDDQKRKNRVPVHIDKLEQKPEETLLHEYTQLIQANKIISFEEFLRRKRNE